MRLENKKKGGMAEGDMTPMIDMTFQLIAFFMVLVNFSDAEQNEAIRLPSSELAKPAETPFEYPITLQIVDQGKVLGGTKLTTPTVLYGGEQVPIDGGGLTSLLVRERTLLSDRNESLSNATIVIRADSDVRMGIVQQVIAACQENRFEKFAFRAMQEDRG